MPHIYTHVYVYYRCAYPGVLGGNNKLDQLQMHLYAYYKCTYPSCTHAYLRFLQVYLSPSTMQKPLAQPFTLLGLTWCASAWKLVCVCVCVCMLLCVCAFMCLCVLARLFKSCDDIMVWGG